MKILKLGGSILTDKKGYKQVRLEQVERLAKTIAVIWRRGVRDLVLVHGAGSFGHAVVLKHGINDAVKNTAQKLGYADTHAACSELSLTLVKALIAQGVPAISIPPAVIIEQKEKRIVKFDTKLVNDYLKSEYLPVLYGDMTPDKTLGGSPCSGDQIVAYLGKGADLVVLATDVDGVMDENEKVIPAITKENIAEVSKHLRSTPNDVTGGMAGKIKELLALDTTSYIVNASHQDRIEALFAGKKTVCTQINQNGR